MPDQEVPEELTTPTLRHLELSDYAQRLWHSCGPGEAVQTAQHHEVLMTPRALFAPCSCESLSAAKGCACDRALEPEPPALPAAPVAVAEEETFTGCGVAGPAHRPVLLRHTEFHDNSVGLAAERGELDDYQAPEATDCEASVTCPDFALGVAKGNTSKCMGCEQVMAKGRWRVIRRRVGASRNGGDLSTWWHTGCFLRRYGVQRKESTVTSHDEAIVRLLISLNSAEGRWRYLETSWLTSKPGRTPKAGYKSAMGKYQRQIAAVKAADELTCS